MANITIPSPVLSGGTHFTVTIKNSAGVTVYGPASQTNASFDPGITDPDTYTMSIDNSGAINGWCFTIAECTTCPTISEITLEEGTPPLFYGYAHFKFDMSGGFQCPFKITGTISTGGGFDITINGLSDFTSHVGSIYDKLVFIGGDSTSITYNIALLDGTSCGSGAVAPACDGPTISATYPRLTPDGSGGYVIVTHYDSCGTTCHEVLWNYAQVVSGIPPNVGTFTDVVPCPPSGPPTQHTVHPVGFLPGSTITYNVVANDCCGLIQHFTLSYDVPCSGPTIPPALSIVFVSGNYYLRAIYADCGADCHGANFSVVQNNVFSSGTNEVFNNNSNLIPCAGPFPLTIDYLLNPNLAISVGTNIRYFITFTNCCGVNIDSVLVTYPL